MRPPVLLFHGLLDSSVTWIINNANQSLAFVLADAGFDVWMGNVRGNWFCRRHILLRETDRAFWEYSLDDHARYDVTSTVNHILRRSQAKKLTYVGHSQGSLVGLMGTVYGQLLMTYR